MEKYKVAPKQLPKDLHWQEFNTDLADNGPVDMFFRKEKSSSGNVNVLLFKVVTKDYEIPWVLLDQIVMKAGEKTMNEL